MTWRLFDQEAARYEAWYATSRGRRASAAETQLLERLLASFPAVGTVLEVGCGTGHFARALAAGGRRVIGLDRAPAMLAEYRRRAPTGPAVLGDAHRLPARDASVDVVAFVTTLEFLEAPAQALREAVRVARAGIVALVLNRWSVGGLSRRVGQRASSPLLGRARDFSRGELRTMLRTGAGGRLVGERWGTALRRDVLGVAVELGRTT